jgi:hypothetical protein
MGWDDKPKKHAPVGDRIRSIKIEHIDVATPECLINKIVEKARHDNKWIYDPSIRRWYTPEEFLSTIKSYTNQDKLIQKVELRDPIEGVEAAFHQIQDVNGRLMPFIKKVIDYFK